MATAERILVVDDEPVLRDAVATVLREQDFEVGVARSGRTALVMADEFDLVVLDVTLPDLDGFEVTRRLRARGRAVPIVLVSALSALEHRLAGLEAGGDDYVAKPFAPAELVARVRAVLRRCRRAAPDAGRLLSGDLVIVRGTGEVFRSGQPVELTGTELRLLVFFVENAGRVVTKREILETVWEGHVVTENLVETYVGYLRRKLDGLGSPLIHTRRLTGYLFNAA